MSTTIPYFEPDYLGPSPPQAGEPGWLQAKEFDLLHDRFDIVDNAVAKLHPPTDGLDLIVYGLCFLLGFFVRGVLA